MEDKSKAEKRAAGRLLLQQYQRKNKNGKTSPSPKNYPSQSYIANNEEEQRSTEDEYLKNGHSENDSDKVIITQANNGTNTNNYFTFQKDYSPAEQFFDSFRPSPGQSTPDNSDKYSTSVHDMSPLPHFNVADRFKDNDKSYECSSSSRSSSSEVEAQKKFMQSQLNSDTIMKEELKKQLIDSNEKVALLENEIQKMKQEVIDLRNQKMPLEEKIQLHLKTIEILVSEKSELQQELSKTREHYSFGRGKVDNLSEKLKASEEQAKKLQKELAETYEAREQHNTILKKLEHSLAEMNSTAEMYRKEVIDSKEEVNVLKHKVQQMTNHCQEMKKAVDEKDKQLSMAEMRLAQSGAGGIPTKADINRIEELEKECNRLKLELTGNEEKFTKEKSEISSEYQQYIDTLNSQMKLFSQQYESCLATNNNLLIREESLVKHISELEKKVQKEHQAGPSLAESNTRLNQEVKEANAKLDELTATINEKNEEVVRLTAALNETSARLSEAELTLERLEVPDARKLQAAIESDKVAATRALQQNTQLKQHMIELQEAVVKLNNEKLELTEKWQHTEHVLSELTRELSKYKTKKEVEYKDAVAQCAVVFHVDNSCQVNIDDIDIPTKIEHVTPEAVGLLERKLKKTMDDYAELYDETQRLEHLVLHLQSETETIGEYVTLYQNQRSLLQERAKERDRQMAALSNEKEDLRLKLAQISSLLPQVIQDSELPAATHSATITNGVKGEEEAPAAKIKTLLSEIESSDLMKDHSSKVQSNFHPCLLCSGKLINI